MSGLNSGIGLWRFLKRVSVWLLLIYLLLLPSWAKTTQADLSKIVSYLNYLYGVNVNIVISPTPYKAFATGQKLVYIDPHVLETNPPEAIFGLLAHEWAHEALGHIPQQFYMYFVNGTNLAEENLWFQEKELEADYYAGRALAIAGIDPKYYIDLIKRYNREADFVHPYFRTHPSTPERIRAVLKGYYSVK